MKSSHFAILALVAVGFVGACVQHTTNNPVFTAQNTEVSRAVSILDLNERPYHIFTSSKSPERVAAEVARLDDEELIEYLVDLHISGSGDLQARDQMQSVIYVIMESYPVGTNIDTQYTYTRASNSIAADPTDQPFTQRFNQVLGQGGEQSPIIIVNGAFSIYRGMFEFELFINGNRKITRFVPVVNDLEG